MNQQTFHFINPFQIDIDPMDRLLLVNIENDPDDIYIGFEPQVFADEQLGEVHLVIGWRRDGKVDVYHQPGMNIDPSNYDIVGKGLAAIVECEFAAAFYEVTDTGVQANYQFADRYQREINIKIAETNSKKRKPFGLLAPMGDAAETPSALPLVLLHDFYFVRKKQTTAEVEINGKSHQPDELPLPIDRAKMLFTRYSPKPLIARFNPAVEEDLIPLEVQLQQEQLTLANCDFTFEWTGRKPAIKSITQRNDIYPVTLRFTEAFPDIKSLYENSRFEGKFELSAHPSTGVIAGNYAVEKTKGETTITIVPSDGWKPRPAKLSLLFLYTAAKIFKHWPKTYEWTANIYEQDNGQYAISSNWRRIR
ncbi:hypothetical protein [Salisediminibacterium halotolerans]|uniref:hypothetical protein n=1 Tax=Salisediminibacterium halotolerans TaxID=517425 RepID=UPI000EACA41B|nr:hypothetical protein [Salisediminibacterium halotolerans]RLJ71791.1 hypothetical protein BCL39_2464 [Actinophytocola xinjiangensis]RPE86941.1 hypothetical protein EDD67_1805 [Salisediminibacterium halotolerans]TWG33004.1 hypothetical protein BCL52_2459 [Salisediminibacterium halotolerans]GEL08601.1 hypothetical protein SHA02_20170 [Salisediminibacterium halotolerans]